MVPICLGSVSRLSVWRALADNVEPEIMPYREHHSISSLRYVPDLDSWSSSYYG